MRCNMLENEEKIRFAIENNEIVWTSEIINLLNKIDKLQESLHTYESILKSIYNYSEFALSQVYTNTSETYKALQAIKTLSNKTIIPSSKIDSNIYLEI